MHTVLDIIHATDRISRHIAGVHASGESAPELSPEEQAESIIAKNRVLRILSRSIQDVQSALNSSAPGAEAGSNDAGPDSLVAMDVATDDNKSPGDVIQAGMTGKDSGLGAQVPSLSQMAEAVGPIVDTFNAIKAKPYLKNYSASINSVPLIGLKGDNVMYTQTQCGGLKGVEDVWSVFGRIPDGLNINSSKAVHFFPYKGDFCMSVGTAIWRKKHRDEKDPEVKLAVNNWPKLYLDAWEKVGDACLPTANARSVLPFARLVGKDIRFHLVVLNDDGRLLALDGDLAATGNTFSELKNTSDVKNAAALGLKIQKAAYWNGNIVAYDDASNTWNLDVDFDAHTFTAHDQMPVDQLFELTATDIGPVGVKKDGWIYRRRVETVQDPSGQADKGDQKVGWDKWLLQNGVAHLGVASPGVMLDLQALTYSLNDRYLSTQTSIYPVVSKMQAFATCQEVWLKSQLASAQQYEKSDDDAAKQKLAISAAKKLVGQTKVWATVMRKQAGYGKDSVNGLGTQLSDVKTQLDQQLIILNDKLVSLQAQIQALKDAKKKMDAAFWISIGTMLLGIGLAVLGACTGVGVIALGIIGGALFVGGLVAACYFGNKSSELAGQISNLESEVRGVNQAIADIKFVAGKFGDLEGMYNSLNQFWGRMFNAAGNLKDMNDATAIAIGASFLDSSSIQGALDISREIKKGCATYLAVMNRSGIKLPTDDSDDESEAGDIITDAVVIELDPTFKTLGIWHEQVRRATQALENGQFAEYEKHMEAADLIDVYTIEMGVPPEAVIEIVKTAHQQETAEAADLFGDLAQLARFTPLGMAVGVLSSCDMDVSGDAAAADAKQPEEPREAADLFGLIANFASVSPIGMAVNVIGNAVDLVARDAEQPQQQNGAEAADLFGDLANFARFTPFGMAVGAIEGAVSRDMDIEQELAEPREAADIFDDLASVARFTPFGMAIGAVEGAFSRDMDVAQEPTEPKEAADLFDDLASVARLTPFGMAVGALGSAFSCDMDIATGQPLKEQEPPRESADLFGVIADFARFTPAGPLEGLLVRAVSQAVPLLTVANPALHAASDLFANAAPFSSDHPSSGMLNSLLGQARDNVFTMLDKTLDLAAVAENWLSQLPDVPSSDDDVSRCAQLQGKALLACKLAMENARLANNAFVDFNHRATEEGLRIQREVTLASDRIASITAQGRAEIDQAMRPQVLDFLAFGVGRINAMSKANEIQRRMEYQVRDIQIQVARLMGELQCGQMFMGKTQTWTQVCEQTSGRLGGIYNVLMSVKYGIKFDAQAYRELAATQWAEIRRDAQQVKSLLQPQGRQQMMVAMDLDVSNDAADMAGTDTDTALLQVSRPAPALLPQLQAQAANSQTVWANIGTLDRLTYTEDIVGYFDVATNRKVTLRDVIGSIKAAYIQAAAMHYQTVEHLSSLALTQRFRAANLARGKISPHMYIKGTSINISMARKQADRVKSLLGELSPGLTQNLSLVKASIDELDNAIASANLDLARRDKAYRDKVTGVLVEGCLRGFATGGLVAAAAFAAYSGVAMASIPAVIAAGGVIFGGKDKDNKEMKPAEDEPKKNGTNGTNGVNGKHATKPEEEEEAEDGEAETDEQEEKEEKEEEEEKPKAPVKKGGQKKDIPVQQRVQAAQDTWTSLSGVMRSAKNAAAGTTLGQALFNKLSLAELAMLVQLVKVAVVVMERTAAAVERLAGPLEELITSVGQVADILDDMDARFAQYKVPVAGESVPFAAKDAAEVTAQWDEVAVACTKWLDIFNAQHISPISYTVG